MTKPDSHYPDITYSPEQLAEAKRLKREWFWQHDVRDAVKMTVIVIAAIVVLMVGGVVLQNVGEHLDSATQRLIIGVAVVALLIWLAGSHAREKWRADQLQAHLDALQASAANQSSVSRED